MGEIVAVRGLSELQAVLDALPAKIERNVMRGALRAGAQVLAAEARALCPVGAPSSDGAKRYRLYPGALRDSIRVGAAVKGGRVTAYVRAGGRLKSGAIVYYARMIEFTGARAHEEHPKEAKSLFISGLMRKQVNHPGFAPKPFMRPALDRGAPAAIAAAGEYVKNRLSTREGLEIPDVQIEVGE